MLLLALPGVVDEACELALVLEKAVPYGCVAVLNYVDLGYAAAPEVRIGVTVGNHDDVGVLLDLAGVAQVGHLRLLRRARFDAAVELGQDDDRDVQFLGHRLDAAADGAELKVPVLLTRTCFGRDQTDVVDDDQVQRLESMTQPIVL